ncbi:putative non-specific serine/threonine protein kinase [Helianthus annuus]|nr:putative non-specific serine/threonine protein kinase [Helianthus annuus]
MNSWYLRNIQNLCNWTGIMCNEGGVVSKISLPNSSLSGTLTYFQFSSFPNLTHFDLNNNHVGCVSPSEIGRLTHLRYLDLNNNNLNGAIPVQISNLQKVWYLNLGGNYLTDPNWSDFTSMPALTSLSLYSNELKNEFPEEVDFS